MDKKIVNVHSTTRIGNAEWEEVFDAVSSVAQAFKDGWLDESSQITGEFYTPVASPTAVKTINDNFDITVSVDNNLQQFEDKEVCKVIAANAGSGNLVTESQFASITSLGTWFQNNTKITEFPEFNKINITTLAGNTCNISNSSIKKINFDKVESMSSGAYLIGCYFSQIGDIDGVGYLPNLKTLGIGWNYTSFNSLNDIYAYFLPSIVTCEAISSYGTTNALVDVKCEFFDFGSKYKNARLAYFANGWNSFYHQGFIVIRSSCEEVTSIASAPKYIYLSASAKEKVDAVIESSSDTFHITRLIGGPEWQESMRTLADKYAKEYAGWTDEQIENADYSHAYIDYDIFGVDKSTAPYVLFDDPEVERVLLANTTHADENVITKEELGAVKKIGNCFDNNDSIKYFDELKDTQITTLGYYGDTRFYNCTNLKSVDFRNIVNCSSYGIDNCKSLEIISMPKCKNFANMGIYFRDYDFSTKAIFIPSCIDDPNIERSELNWNKETKLEHIDVGKNCTKVSNMVFYCLGRGNKASVVFRGDTQCSGSSFINSLEVLSKYIYVQPELLESYKTRQAFSTIAERIKPIGSAEWVAEFGSDDKYANIDKYEKNEEMRALLKQANES